MINEHLEDWARTWDFTPVDMMSVAYHPSYNDGIMTATVATLMEKHGEEEAIKRIQSVLDRIEAKAQAAVDARPKIEIARR